MDKKYLRSLPVEQAPPAFFEMARENQKMAWLMVTSKAGGILQITAYDAEKLRKDNPAPRYRLFFDEYDYITQDLASDRTKWLTGKISSVFRHDWHGTWDWKAHRYSYDRIVPASGADTEAIREHFDREPKHPERPILWCINDWQDTVLEGKLEERHRKELQHTREMMGLVPELPDDFDSWLDGYVMRDKRYLVYDGDRKKTARGAYCTHCGQLMMIDSKKTRLRMNDKGTCPECGSTVTMKPFRRMANGMRDHKGAAIIQRLSDDQILVRYFGVSYTFRKAGPYGIVRKERYVSERCREFITGSGKNMKVESFEFAVYKQRGLEQWCPDTGAVECGEAVVYTNGLRETLAGTDWQYSGLEAFQENEGCHEIPVWRYLNCYPETKELEILVKAGLTSLASELVRDPWTWRSGAKSRRKIPDDLAKLNGEHRKILRDMNGGTPMISLLRDLELSHNMTPPEDIKEFIRTFGSEKKLVLDIGVLGISIRRFTRYTQKQLYTGRNISGQKRRERVRDFVHDWRDYIGWSRDLQYNMDDEYVLMPPDFRKAHDRLMEEAKQKQDEIQRRKMEKQNRQIRKVLAEIRNSGSAEMKTKKFMIVVPSSPDDLRKEGQALHHCVATYAERVAKGETVILFVRKTDMPDEPFFTLEWKDNKVSQCRGARNCSMPDDVRAFVKAFEKKMQGDLENKDRQQKEKVG